MNFSILFGLALTFELTLVVVVEKKYATKSSFQKIIFQISLKPF